MVHYKAFKNPEDVANYANENNLDLVHVQNEKGQWKAFFKGDKVVVTETVLKDSPEEVTHVFGIFHDDVLQLYLNKKLVVEVFGKLHKFEKLSDYQIGVLLKDVLKMKNNLAAQALVNVINLEKEKRISNCFKDVRI